MNLDDLKGGLSTLLDEMEPFEGNVQALHRHERRRRIAMSSIAAVVVVAITMAALAATRHGDSGRIHIAGFPSKQVTPDKITHVDAIVLPASPAVKAALDASPLVGRYARVPAGDRSSAPNLLVTDAVRSALCALQTNDGYAVDATTPGTDIGTVLGRTLFGTGQVTIYPTDQFSVDAEVFMKVTASTQQSAAVRTTLVLDPDVGSVHFLDRSDAYAIYKKEFAAQSALVESTKPTDLPESFRIFVKPGRSVANVVQRYRNRAGVDTIIMPDIARLFDSTSGPTPSGNIVSPCASP